MYILFQLYAEVLDYHGDINIQKTGLQIYLLALLEQANNNNNKKKNYKKFDIEYFVNDNIFKAAMKIR